MPERKRINPGGRESRPASAADAVVEPTLSPATLPQSLAGKPEEQRAQVIGSLSRAAGNAAVSRWLARQSAAKEAPAKPTVDLGWFQAETNLQLAAAARIAVSEMERELQELEAGSAAGVRAAEWLQTVNDWLPYLDAKSAEPIESVMASLATRKLEEYGEIRNAIREEKLAPLREAWRRAELEAEAAAETAEGLQPQFDEALRAAFRRGGADTVKEAVSTVKSAISIGRNLRSLAFDISKEIFKLNPPSGTKMYIRWPWDITKPIKVQIVSVSRYTEMLTKLNRGLAIVSLALTIADRGKRATELEQGMKDLNDVVGGSSDLGTLGGLPPHVSLYMTLYIKPMLKVITAQIGHLVEGLSDVNRAAVRLTGELMYPAAEPGGQPMFEFMLTVMRADREDQVPRPPGAVAKYLYEHRDKLAAGTEESVPTSGWWLWEDLDSDKARQWIFANRKRVWAMFYGSMEVPARR